ncbi:DUF4837 family protein [Antarcticibacterium sp. 1MA-6-2]|uniref:DUF4837 family protein n=1 Tax=Antarcticibacterium sp. 1MA-6-2 TaxID=2908210 RepID=UPI001F285BDC|nr:DUF4837 family protein [Antarcticibacterium sp. 1MA-6-2]UJH90214.1 DUF4837 family protein [Antarcticibacterium sp. 1MA-6-2]
MKNIIFLAALFVLMLSCKGSGEEEKLVLTSSSGNINNISVVVDNENWEGSIGEALRNNLAAPVDGLPQDEPLFSLNQMPPESFKGFVRKNRLFVKIEEGKNAGFKVFNDPFAQPQRGVLITGQNSQEIVEQINQNSEELIKAFKNTEIEEKQRRIRKSLKDDSRLKEQMGISMKFPTAYRYAVEDDDFFWIRKDIPKGMMEIMVYEVPMNVIEKDTNIIGNIIRMRDSIGEAHIPGPVEGSYMITEEAYAPYLFHSQLDGKFAYETRGTWEVKNAFMAGPFLNYAVRDSVNNRYVILEGFAFSPATAKRDNMFELEAILRSAEFE